MVNDIYKLDLKDKKILSELDKNCRQSNSQIAKKVGLSTEVVNYRIKKLEEENIITQYQTALNLSKLGIIHFKLCLSFQHITSKELNERITRLKGNKNVKWLVLCNGAWDLIATLETDSIINIDILKNEILSLFSGYILEQEISIGVEAAVYNRNFITGGQSQGKKVLLDSSTKEKLEEVDMKILKILSENARMSVVDLSTKLNLTARVVSYRIKQLMKNKIIEGFRIAINYNKLGVQFYKGFIYLENPEKSKIEDMVNYFASHKNIIHHVKVLGSWDLEPEFEVLNEAEFNKILIDIKDKYSNIIKKIDVITIKEEYKAVYF